MLLEFLLISEKRRRTNTGYEKLYTLPRQMNDCLADHPGRYPNGNGNPDLQFVERVRFLV